MWDYFFTGLLVGALIGFFAHAIISINGGTKK